MLTVYQILRRTTTQIHVEICAAILHLSSCSYMGAHQEHHSTGKLCVRVQLWGRRSSNKGNICKLCRFYFLFSKPGWKFPHELQFT